MARRAGSRGVRTAQRAGSSVAASGASGASVERSRDGSALPGSTARRPGRGGRDVAGAAAETAREARCAEWDRWGGRGFLYSEGVRARFFLIRSRRTQAAGADTYERAMRGGWGMLPF